MPGSCHRSRHASAARSLLLCAALLALTVTLAAAGRPSTPAMAQGGAEVPLSIMTVAEDTGRRYRTPGDDIAAALASTADGGFVIAGSVELDAKSLQALVLRFDRHGLPEWSRLFAPSESIDLFRLLRLADGDLLAIGDAENPAGQTRTALLRLAPDGALRWSAQVDSPPATLSARAALELEHGDILFGLDGEDADGAPFAMVTRISADGSETWRQVIAGLHRISDLIHLPQSGPVAVGHLDVDDAVEIRLVAIAGDGTATSLATLQTDGKVQAYRAAALADGSIAMAAGLSDADDAPAAVLLTAPDGSIRWLRQVTDRPGWIDDIAVMPDGDLVVAGSLTDADGNGDALVGRLSPDGAWRWAQLFAGPHDTHFYAIGLRPDGHLLASGSIAATANDGNDPDLDAWLVLLSSEGRPLHLDQPVTDALLRTVAEEMHLAGRSYLGETGAGSEGFGKMAPPAFYQDGDRLVMATAPVFLGPILLNVTRTVFETGTAPGIINAETVIAQPLLQGQADGVALFAEAEHQQISWRYALGSFLPEAVQLDLAGIRIAAPDGFSLHIDRVEGRAGSSAQADGSRDLDSRISIFALSGKDLDETAAPQTTLSLEQIDLSGTTTGIDVQGYAAAVRAAVTDGLPADPTAFARGYTGTVAVRHLSFGHRDVDSFGHPFGHRDADDDSMYGLTLDGAGISVAMVRDSLATPADLQLVYSLDQMVVVEGSVMLGKVGSARLNMAGTAVDLDRFRAEAALPDLDDGMAMDADDALMLERVLRGVGGIGLELAIRDVEIGGDVGGLAAARIAFSLQGIRENEAELRIALASEGVSAPPGSMAPPDDLLPREAALEIVFGPLPAIDMIIALAMDREDEMPGMLGQAAPTLEIARLALVTEAGEISGNGDFAFDPTSPLMLTGAMTFLVVDMERLRRRVIEEAPEDDAPMIGAFAGFLEGMAERAQGPDARPASRFLVQALPNGTITVNGRPFPPDN